MKRLAVRSIGARLALWYAVAATATLAILFVVGYFLLQGYLIHGLDLLIQSEFGEIEARLGPDLKSLDAAAIDQRIRESSEYASVLFYIDVHSRNNGTVFYSRNLGGRAIPDIRGKRKYDVELGNIGLVRVGEYILPPYDVILATPEAPIAGVMTGYIEVCAGLLASMLAASVAIGVGLSRIALRPVRLIRDTASRIGYDNLSERIPVPEVDDEISELARLLNAMFDRLEASFRHVRCFAADASHELKTPLSLMRLHAEKLLAQGSRDGEREDQIVGILEEVTRLNATIDELLFLSRAEAHTLALELRPHDPAVLLTSFSADAQVLAESRGLNYVVTHLGAGQAICEPRWVRRLLLNLVSNAVNASPPGGRIQLRSSLESSWWRFSVEDEGPGVPASERERIFDRFVRLHFDASAQSQGTGLGLAICRGIVELHHGRIFAEAGPEDRGLRVVVEIPAQSAPTPAPFTSSEPAIAALT